jgi:hypothetical protein
MKKPHNNTWTFNGDTFTVGDSLNDTMSEHSLLDIVWHKGKLYKFIRKPKTSPKLDRIALFDIYNSDKKVYWTTVDKVYQVIKIS